MIANANQLIQKRELLRTWADRIIRTRYQQSVLGILWVVIQPAAVAIMFSIIFTYFVPIDTGDTPYIVFSYVAMVPWMLLSGSLPDMTTSLVSNAQLVQKIYFPREILPLAALLARLVDFLIAAGLLVVLILVFRVPIFPVGWLFLPLILLIQLLLIAGLGLALAAANVFYRDVTAILPLGIQLWFYASPIVYPISMVPERILPIYYLNPMVGILESYRAVLLYQSLPSPYLYLSGLIAFTIFILGYWFFKRVEFRVPDIL